MKTSFYIRLAGTVLILFSYLISPDSDSKARNSQSINTESRLLAAVQNFIRHREGQNSDEIQISRIKYRKKIPASVFYKPFSISTTHRGELNGRVLFCLVPSSMKDTQKYYYSCVIQRYRNCVVAGRRLDRNRTITRDDIKIEKRVVMPNQHVFGALMDVIGKQTKQMISSGRALSESMIQPIPIIAMGDIVTIKFQTKNISITMPGKARRNGYKGQKIPVQNLSNGKIVNARVDDSKTVLVEM